jgi:hypothetical protein
MKYNWAVENIQHFNHNYEYLNDEDLNFQQAHGIIPLNILTSKSLSSWFQHDSSQQPFLWDLCNTL